MAGLTIPITEKLMKKKRGDKFTEYCSTTNKFLPIWLFDHHYKIYISISFFKYSNHKLLI